MNDDERYKDAALDLAGTCGALLISIGSGLIYEPAGYIVAGIILLAGAVLAARGD